MAAAKGWNGGHQIAFFVSLNQDGECSFWASCSTARLYFTTNCKMAMDVEIGITP
jgi:hypothetical protein